VGVHPAVDVFPIKEGRTTPRMPLKVVSAGSCHRCYSRIAIATPEFMIAHVRAGERARSSSHSKPCTGQLHRSPAGLGRGLPRACSSCDLSLGRQGWDQALCNRWLDYLNWECGCCNKGPCQNIQLWFTAASTHPQPPRTVVYSLADVEDTNRRD
jgi:hypothetical protein